MSGLWLQPLDRIKIERYKKQSLVVGIQFAFTSEEMLTLTHFTVNIFERFDYVAKTRLVEGFLCFTLSVLYSALSYILYLSFSEYCKQSSIL